VRPGLITKPDIHTIKVVACFVFATFCFFQAVQAWGANYTALFLDLAVIVPLGLLVFRGGKVGLSTIVAFLVAVLGTAITLKIFQEVTFSFLGLFWSLGAMLANGLVIQFAGEAKQENWNKAFWMSAGLVLVGMPAFFLESLNIGAGSFSFESWIFLLVVFAITTGMLNFYSSFVAFEHLGSVAVGVLVLGVTPSIMTASYFLLNHSLGWDQIIGVVITLVAVLMFGNTLRQTEVKR
jgi:drug/metabolite transporter (DMT)-like permease